MNDPRPFAVRRFPAAVTLVTLAVAALIVVHIGVGRVALTPFEVVAALRNTPVEEFHAHIVRELRQPRALIAAVAGALLGLAGALLQAVTRNPLAEPGLLGVSAGGVLAVALLLTATGGSAGQLRVLPLAALAGGLAAGVLVWALAGRGHADPLRLVLGGVLVNALLVSATSLLLLRSGETLGGILPWVIGSLNARVWSHWAVLWPWALVSLPLGFACVRVAAVLQLGDDVGAGLGLVVPAARAGLFAVAAALTAGAVSVAGAIGFVGLIAPHLARRVVGDHATRVLPLAALLGAGLLSAADVVASTLTLQSPFGEVANRAAVPVGAVTALLGAPFFLWLVRQAGR